MQQVLSLKDLGCVVQAIQTTFSSYVMRSLYKNQNEKYTSYKIKRSYNMYF